MTRRSYGPVEREAIKKQKCRFSTGHSFIWRMPLIRWQRDRDGQRIATHIPGRRVKRLAVDRAVEVFTRERWVTRKGDGKAS